MSANGWLQVAISPYSAGKRSGGIIWPACSRASARGSIRSFGLERPHLQALRLKADKEMSWRQYLCVLSF